MADGTIGQDPQQELAVHRVKLIVQYNGSRFKGFQRQSSSGSSNSGPSNRNVVVTEEAFQPSSKRQRRALSSQHDKQKKVPLTIQECMEDRLEHYTGLDRNQLRFRFAGRTDGGVHARGQVVVISVPKSLLPIDEWKDNHDNKEGLWKIRKSINSRLPEDISVESVDLLSENSDFDPRKDAIRKQYSYTLKYRRKVFNANGELLSICTSGPNCIRGGLDPKTLWVCPWTLDDSKMEHFCQQLTGKHDYSAFVHKSARREKDNTLTVERFHIERLEESAEAAPILTVRFLVEAKGFRRSMVRNLVGFLVDLCRGQVDESVLDVIWTGTDEVSRYVHSAPPFGLCLEHVEYK